MDTRGVRKLYIFYIPRAVGTLQLVTKKNIFTMTLVSMLSVESRMEYKLDSDHVNSRAGVWDGSSIFNHTFLS